MQFTVEIPKQNTQQPAAADNRPQVDWAAKDEYVASVLGIGTHTLIGQICLLTDLGIQPREEQELVWNDKVKGEQGWRLESYEDGNPKCEGARLTTKMIKGKETEILVYPQESVAQMAISVDFPEKMLNLDQFFNPQNETPVLRPFRDIIGRTGWGNRKTDAEGNTKPVVAKPFNLSHTNVNRAKKDAKPHYAFGKTGMLYDLAKYCKVLDADDNFHIADISKLLGKACMFTVVVEWNEYTNKAGNKVKRLETKITPSAVMSPRDEAFYNAELLPLIEEDSAGMLLFKGGNRERDLKVANSILKNTMSFATNWNDSVLKKELEGDSGSSQAAPQTPPEPAAKAPVAQPKPTPVQVNTTVAKPAVVDLDSGWDDSEIPF
jgi:hypothetical protein